MRQADIVDEKPWRLRKMKTDLSKALGYARDTKNRVAHREWMIEAIERDICKVAAELKRQGGMK